MSIEIWSHGNPCTDIRLRKLGSCVFTNGCFAGIHAGHIECIRQAGQYGLVVLAFNSKASVCRLKGYPEEVVIDDEVRGVMLSMIPGVLCAVRQHNDTPMPLLHEIRPRVLFKGGTTGEICGAEFVESYGGRVVRGDVFADGLSFSRIQDKR